MSESPGFRVSQAVLQYIPDFQFEVFPNARASADVRRTAVRETFMLCVHSAVIRKYDLPMHSDGRLIANGRISSSKG